MTFINIVKILASKWINTLSNTCMIEGLVTHETQAIQIATPDSSNQLSADRRCNEF
jgi:hypothetical protein